MGKVCLCLFRGSIDTPFLLVFSALVSGIIPAKLVTEHSEHVTRRKGVFCGVDFGDKRDLQAHFLNQQNRVKDLVFVLNVPLA